MHPKNQEHAARYHACYSSCGASGPKSSKHTGNSVPDVMTPAQRSRTMSRIRGKDTKPELALRRALHARGLRYRVHDATVPGRPDISHKGAKVAIFVDGCFWHGCPQHYQRPATNQEYWDHKIQYNQARREAVLAKLKARDWKVAQYWECDVAEDLDAVKRQVGELLAQRPRWYG